MSEYRFVSLVILTQIYNQPLWEFLVQFGFLTTAILRNLNFVAISKFQNFQYVFSLQPIPTDPNESFAWKDSTLDRKLKELEERAKKQGDVHLDVNGFDKNIDKSIGSWSSLPKAPNSDILLLQKARGKITTKIKY